MFVHVCVFMFVCMCECMCVFGCVCVVYLHMSWKYPVRSAEDIESLISEGGSYLLDLGNRN